LIFNKLNFFIYSKEDWYSKQIKNNINILDDDKNTQMKIDEIPIPDQNNKKKLDPEKNKK